MRILKISFENINSLRGTHTIDFQNESAFRNSNLFAITGPTGAGKTTILDVITLALYHRTPRLGEVNTNLLDKLGGILTRDTNVAWTEVTFATPLGTYRAKWSLQREVISRGENKGKFRLEEYSEITDIQKDIILASKKKKEVQEQIKKCIGLDYDQFVKAILLSQGDFSAFLKAKREERAELLERITGTEIYRKIGAEAYRRWTDDYKQEIEKKKQSLDLQKLLSDEDVKGFNESILEFETLYQQAETGRKLLEVQVQRKKRIQDIRKTLETIQVTEYPAWLLDQKQFDTEYAPRLSRHQTVQQFAPQLTDYQLQEQQTQNLHTQIQRLTAEQIQAQKNQKTLLEDIAKLTGGPVSEMSAQQSIEGFREKVLGLVSSQQDALQRWNSAKEQAYSWLEQLQDSGEIPSLWRMGAYPDCLNVSRELFKEIQRRQTSLREKYGLQEHAEFPDLIKNSKVRRDGLQQLENQVRQYEQVRRRLSVYDEKIKSHQETILQQKPLVAKAQESVSQAQGLLQMAQDEQFQFIRETSIPRLQSELKPDEACPVCGSVHHPGVENPHTEQQFSVEKYLAELANLKARYEARERTVATQEKQFREADTALKTLEATIQTLEREKANAHTELQPIAMAVSQLKTQLQIEKIGKADEIQSLLHTESTRLQELEELMNAEKRSEGLVKFGQHLKKGLEVLQKQQEISTELKKTYGKESRFLAAECDDLLRKLVLKNYAPSQYDTEITESKKQHTEVEKGFFNLRESLHTALQNEGFESIAEAKTALLSTDTYQKLTDRKETLIRRKTQLDTQIDNLTKETDALIRDDDTELDVNTLEKRIEDYRISEREYQQKIGGWKQSLKDNDSSRHEHARRLEEIAVLEERYQKWKLLAEGLGDREGKRFNQFAQKLTLANLTRSANSRLKDLSDRYLLLPPEGDEENLWVLDSNFDERRAVATLSGGETFLVSLALALGLSDMVSKNVRIESLFIDEGFGTLDPETLEIALGTLEKLQAESNRMIGIISHVEGLKERITTQIRLRKQASGFSLMEIVG